MSEEDRTQEKHGRGSGRPDDRPPVNPGPPPENPGRPDDRPPTEPPGRSVKPPRPYGW